MRNNAFVFGGILCLLTLAIDLSMLLNGLAVLGVFSVMGTLMVFAAGFIWLVYQDDRKINLHRPLLVIPLVVFGVAISTAFQNIPVLFQLTPENLNEVGNLLMSRYQIGLWIVSAIIFFYVYHCDNSHGEAKFAMTIVLVATAVFALIIVFCVRHFFVQLIAVKLLIDCLVAITASVRIVGQSPYTGETTSVMIGSLGLLIFFVLLATGIQRFSSRDDLEAEAENE